MKKSELSKMLNELIIPTDAYSLSGGLPNEAYCISEKNGEWEVHYSERGNMTNKKMFQCEDEVCGFFYNWIRRSFKI